MPTPTTSVQSTNLALTRASFWDGTPHTIIGAYKAGGWTSQSGEYSAGYSWWLGYRFAGWGDKWITTSETTIDSTKWIWIAHTSTGSAGTCHFFEDGAGSATSESAGTDYTGADLMVLDGAAINRVSAIFVYDHVLTASEILAQSRTSVPLYSGLLHYSRNDSDAAVGVDSGSGSWSFSVAGAGTTVADAPAFPDDSSGPAAPVLTSTDPADEETDVDPSAPISLTYDGDIEAVSGKNITLIKVVAPSSPTVVGTPTAQPQSTNTANPVVAIPDVLEGDVVIIGVVKDGTGAVTAPGDWNIGVDSTNTARIVALWKRFTVDTAGHNVSLTGAAEHYERVPTVVRGAHATWNPEFSTAATGSSGAANPPSLTPSWPGSWPYVGGYFVGLDGSALASFSFTHPTGWTANGGAALTAGTQTDRCAAAWSYNTGLTGTIDPGAGTHTSEQWMAVTWAVPAADPSTTIEVIAADSGQVVITNDTAVITPTDPLPASSRIRVLADEGAFEADGGSAPSAAIVAGMLEFLTGTGANGVAIGFGAPAAQFAATAAATASASAAFAAPHAVMAGQLSAIGSTAAGFVAPAAVLGMTLGIAAEAAVSVGFLAPPASLAATLAAEGSVGVGFSAPAAQLAAGLAAVASAALGMSAPSAQMSALVGLEGAVTLGMTAAAPSMSATVGAIAGVSAGMSAPSARLDAALGAEASAAVGFVVPPSSFAATMGLRGSASLGFVAPPAELGMQLAHEGVSLVAIGFVAPPAAMAAALGAEAAAQLGFAAPAPSLGATVGAVAGASVGFAPPAARFDASLEAVPSGGFAVGFTAPAAVLAAALAAEGSVGVGFYVPPAALGMTAAVGVEVTLGFVVPAAALSMTLDDPNGYVQAQFVVPAAVMAMAVIHANAFIPPATGETIGQFAADHRVGQFEADYQIGKFA